MSNHSEKRFADYWYEGFQAPLSREQLPYQTFWELPLIRKPLYIALFSVCLALKMVLAVVKRIPGVKLPLSLCDGIAYPPQCVPLEAYGRSKERVAQAGDDAEHYLSSDEIATFNRDGVIGPFRAMSEEEAAKLLKDSEPAWKDRDMKKTILANSGKGMPIHVEVPELADLWRKPVVARKLASLLGDDPKVWRSQFFARMPGESGTFWHQATTFKEGNRQPSVLPGPGQRDNIAQLTLWCALTPAKKENACMRFMKGSQEIQEGLAFLDNLLYNRTRLILAVSQRSIRFIHNSLLSIIGQPRVAASAFPMILPLYDEFLNVYGKFFEERCQPATMELKPGEFVIFTSATMHGSWPNVTDDPRVACVARVAATDATIHKDYEQGTMRLFDDQQAVERPESELISAGGA